MLASVLGQANAFVFCIAVAANQTLYGILGITLVLLAGGIMLMFVKAPAVTKG